MEINAQVKVEEKVTEKFRYFKKPSIGLSCNSVSYVVMDKNSRPLNGKDWGETNPYAQGITNICFSQLFRNLNKEAHTIFIFHDKFHMPYQEQEIIRYTSDLNEMGFPFKYNGENGGHVLFEIELSEITTKGQFCSILTLIRTLYETPGTVPEYYLSDMDDNPDKDKFVALQNAHLKAKPSMGHNVLGHSWGSEFVGYGKKLDGTIDYDKPIYEDPPTKDKTITREELFKRFAEAKLTPYDAGAPNLNIAWGAYKKESVAA